MCALIRPALAADEVVYSRVRVVSGGELVEESVIGSPRVTLADGSEFVVSADNLEAPDGARFGIDSDIGQDEADGPLLVRTTILRLDQASATDDERLAGYLEENPELTAAEAERAMAAAEAADPESAQTVEVALAEWLASASAADRARVVLGLREDPALDVPSMADFLIHDDPAAALDALEERTLAIEARKSRIDEIQVAFIEDALGDEGAGAVGDWLGNQVEADLTASTVRRLVGDSRVIRLELAHPAEPDSNDGVEVRAATQVQQFIDAGYDGEHPTGLSTYDHTHVVVIDSDLDEDHPAFNDGASGGVSRLTSLWRYTTVVGVTTWWNVLPLGYTSTTSNVSHGMAVASTLLGDLTDGQDPTVTASAERARRSGNCLECTFSFVESSGTPSVNSAWAVAGDLFPDVLNRSESCPTCTPCDTDYTENASVDALYLLNIFVVNTPGNERHDVGVGACTVRSPGTAAGSFTPNCYEHVGVTDLNSAPICSTASRGGDSHGRALIDLVATGRETPALPMYDDVYSADTGGPWSTWGQSSAAAPTIAGAVANLKDFLITEVDSSVFNDVGHLYATMLLMGDGTAESGAGNPVSAPDSVWGVGRMRMRLFNAAGMDAPWRARWCSRLLTPGDVGTCASNPDSGGTNQSIPVAVDVLRGALWWFEPNVGSAETPATITFRARRNGAVQHTAQGAAQVKRIRAAASVGGSVWSLEAVGSVVPQSTHGSYYHLQQKRMVYIAQFWEDTARDDLDGPAVGIQ